MRGAAVTCRHALQGMTGRFVAQRRSTDNDVGKFYNGSHDGAAIPRQTVVKFYTRPLNTFANPLKINDGMVIA